MPKINTYLIKNIDKLPETYTVSYYDAETDQNSTAEEWKQLNPTANPSEVRVINKDGTYVSWKTGVDYPAYGPGFWNDWDDFFNGIGEGAKEVGKFGAKVAVAGVAAGAIISTGGFAVPIGAVALGTGEWAKHQLKGQEGTDVDIARFLADTMSMTGSSAAMGGLIGTGSKSIASRASNSAFNAGIRTAGTNGSAVLLRAWIYTKAAQEGYDLCSKTKPFMEGFCHFFHGQHKGGGESYKSDCPVCNGNLDKFIHQIV